MRFKLQFQLCSREKTLPINYKYEFSSWIYKVFEKADPLFSQWLHENGYDFQNRKFKLFTFSDIIVSRFRIIGDRLLIEQPSIELFVSFLMPLQAEKFITGLFMGQAFTLGDIVSRVKLEVTQVETLPEPLFNTTMVFQTRSPICVTLPIAGKSPDYLPPTHTLFGQRFFDNLISKFIAHKKSVPSFAGTERTECGSLADIMEESTEMKLEVLSPFKSRLVTIKSGTPQQTKIKGYIFKFQVTAPIELLKIGYYAGFGEKNSGCGFGCVEVFPVENI